MHKWGDKNFDWKGIGDAIDYIHNRLTNIARIGVHSKEKYGTARISCYFVSDFHSLTHPGYVYSQYPKWLWAFNVYYSSSILKYTGIRYMMFKWQKFVYIQTYKSAVKRWPHLKAEICMFAQCIEWLETAGICKQSDYWKTV